MSATQRIAVYPGTFDPITLGHMDIILRAARVVDHLIVGVAVNAGKGPLFTVEQRRRMVEAEVKKISAKKGLAKISVRAFDNLLMDFVNQCGAGLIVRGLRAVSDFEYEFQMAGMNAKLDDSVETIFLMASDKYQLISSRFVKEIAMLGGDVRHFVSTPVFLAMKKEFKKTA